MTNQELQWESDFFMKTAKADLIKATKLSGVMLITSIIAFVIFIKVKSIADYPLLLITLITAYLSAMYLIDSYRNFLRNRDSIKYKVDDFGITVIKGPSEFFYPWNLVTGYQKVNTLVDAKFYDFPTAKQHIGKSLILSTALALMYKINAGTVGESTEVFGLTFSQINKNLKHLLYVLDINGAYITHVTLDVPVDYEQVFIEKLKRSGNFNTTF
jgi:hypothetical protein